MTPFFLGQPTNYETVSRACVGRTIIGVKPVISPKWAPNSRVLGVTSKEVLPPDPQSGQHIRPGMIGQDSGGMSVMPILDSALLPPGRIPKRNGGRGSNVDCWFALNRDVVESASLLRLHFDIGNTSGLIEHGVIEPGKAMLPEVFIDALHATQSNWHCINH